MIIVPEPRRVMSSGLESHLGDLGGFSGPYRELLLAERAVEGSCRWVFHQVHCLGFVGAFPLHFIDGARVLMEWV